MLFLSNYTSSLFQSAILSILCFVLAPSLFSQNEALGWQSKVHEQIFEHINNDETIPVIIEMVKKADLEQAKSFSSKSEKGKYVFSQLKKTADHSQSELIQYLESKNIEYQSFWINNLVLAYCNYEQIKEIAKLKEIKKIQYNIRLVQQKVNNPLEVVNRSVESVEWGISQINADDVWDLGYSGLGVVVGGQDTGVDWDHEALIDKYRGWDGSSADHNYHWHDAIHEINENNPPENPCGLDSPEPCDDHYHGTHTVGTIVGTGPNTEIGVAPDAQWVACRNMERGDGTPATYLECFEWFLAPTDLNGENPDPSLAPHVINNSWTCPPIEGCDESYDFSIMEDAILNLELAGVVVVVSAGNDGPGCSSIANPPAFYSASFSVGATNSSDEVASFSSRGPTANYGSPETKPDVSAPGVSVYSCEPDDEYGTHSGTSMAGPHVAGVVALLISAAPELEGDVDAIKDILEQSAVPLITTQECGGVGADEIPNNVFGHGRVDALAAVNLALGSTPLTLLRFEGKTNENAIDLEWEVADQPDDGYFLLEKSSPSQPWFELGRIENKEGSQVYHYRDIQYLHPKSFYRLKIFEGDGSYYYSEVIRIITDNQSLPYFYPNPLKGSQLHLDISNLKNEYLEVEIKDLNGKVIFSRELIDPSNEVKSINTTHLMEGIYILELRDQNTKRMIKRFKLMKL